MAILQSLRQLGLRLGGYFYLIRYSNDFILGFHNCIFYILCGKEFGKESCRKTTSSPEEKDG